MDGRVSCSVCALLGKCAFGYLSLNCNSFQKAVITFADNKNPLGYPKK